MRPIFIQACFLLLWLLLTPAWGQTPTASPTPVTSPTPAAISSPEPVSPSPAAETPVSTATPVEGEPTPADETPTAAEATPTATPTPTLTPIPADSALVNPRAAYLSFLQAMQVAGPLRPDLYPTGHLDLSGYPALVRGEKGIELCQQLKTVLDAAEIDVSTIPEETEETRIRLYRQPSGDQVLLELQPDGNWIFPAETVAAVPAMYEVLTKKGRIERWQPPAWLDFIFLGLTGVQWAGLLVFPLLAYLIGRISVLLARRLVRRMLSNERFGVEEEEQKHVLRPLGYLIGSIIFWLALPVLQLGHGLLVFLALVTKLVGASAAVLSAYRLCDVAALYFSWVTAQTEGTFDDMLVPLVRRTLKLLIGMVGVLFVAQNLEINVWSLFAGFSVLGAMVALAGQDLVKNFFGSLTVLLDRPFSQGDWVVIEGTEGVVEDVGFRSTRIRTFYDSVISVPNSRLITATVDNYGARNYRRYSKKLNIVYHTPPDRVEAFCEGIRELIRVHPYTRKDSYQVWVNDMSDFSLQILLYVFWITPDWNTELREKHRLLMDIHRLAASLGVDFAYPTTQVHMERQPLRAQEKDKLTQEQVEEARGKGKKVSKKLVAQAWGTEKPPPQLIE